MNRTQKKEFVTAFSERLRAAPLIVLADYRGTSVAEINEFRRHLEQAGVEYQVVKNTLAKRAIEGTDLEGLGDFLEGMTGWVLSGEEPVGAAKALKAASKGLKKAEKFVVKGGFFDGEVVDATSIAAVASLPSRDELLSLLLRTMQEAPRRVLGMVQAPARDLLYLLKNYENKLEDAQ